MGTNFVENIFIYKNNKLEFYYGDEDLSEEELNKLYQEKKELERKKKLRILRKKAKQELIEEESQIVAFAKPIGKWTTKIMKEYIPKIQLKTSGKTGFWQIRVTLQSREQGKYRGRSR